MSSIILLLFLVSLSPVFPRKREYTICDNEECKYVANLILSGMNQTVNPCEDFYSFVCGSWSNNHPVPKTKEKWNLNTMLDEKIQIDLKSILEVDITNNDTLALQVEKQWYAACMDEERLRKKGFEPVTKLLENVGGWPLVCNDCKWNEYEFSWQKVAKYYAGFFGEYSLFSISIDSLPNNSTIKVLTLDRTSYSLFRTLLPIGIDEDDYYDGNIENDDNDDDSIYMEEEKKLLITVVKAYAKSIGMTKEINNKEIQKVINFKKMLKKIKRVHSTNNSSLMTIFELQQFYDEHNTGSSSSKINWLEIFRALSVNSDIKINDDEKLLLLDRGYIIKLARLLSQISHKTIVNYIHWTFVKDSLKYLDKEKRQWYSNSLNTIYGIKEDKKRWEYCIEHLPLVHGYNQAYIKKYFSESSKVIASKMGDELREGVEKQINRANWMDENTKFVAQQKLKAMKFHIGYPETFKNETFFDHVYDGLKLGPDYFKNVLSYFIHGTKQSWDVFRNSAEKNEFAILPTTANAVYYMPDNALTIPAAQLKSPLFNAALPTAVNYGSTGFIMAHEIFHGFDNEGRMYDKNGNKLNWWSDRMIELYKEKSKCFVEQFNNYKINGELTEGENIADTAGLITAFEVYKNKIRKHNINDKILPGLQNISRKQLYFISFASTFCDSLTPEYREQMRKKDEHSTTYFRINGAVSNSEEFSRAFRCSKNSPMNPERKCNILK
ncbi:neprilysin-4-like [Leptopilina boulardi]|uniref:neprilysin-4-like n=1 Tax=Leptopilina boulardi TaxID=63433 RepID=UPI0021F51504|nr:neprilysin-4-like [Leptopilina boulardi]